MDDNDKIRIVYYLLGLIGLAFILTPKPVKVKKPDPKVFPDNCTTQELTTPTPTATPTPWPDLDFTVIEDMFITDYYLELESLGYYYITAYSPLETGCWYTATDTYCHAADYENRYTEPTTCAVDPRIHNIGAEDGDLFYIAEFDRVYIAEDTGGAVKGKHIDVCFTDDTLDSVYYFPTGYYEVYSVKVIEYTRLKTPEELRE